MEIERQSRVQSVFYVNLNPSKYIEQVDKSYLSTLDGITGISLQERFFGETCFEMDGDVLVDPTNATDDCLLNGNHAVVEVFPGSVENCVADFNKGVDGTKKGLERKRRIRDPECSKRNIQKRRRAEGKFCVTNSEEIEGLEGAPEKQFVYITQCCVKNCYKAISNDQQHELFQSFYSLANKVEQDRYLSRCMLSSQIKWPRNNNVKKHRSNTWKYSVAVHWKETNCRVVVCRNLFLQLFQVTQRRVRTIAGKILKGMTDFKDRRGTHENRVNKIPAEVWVLFDEHLTSLASRSHSDSNEDSINNFKCLNSLFTVKTMFSLFQDYFKERTNTNLKMKYPTYEKYLRDHHYQKQVTPTGQIKRKKKSGKEEISNVKSCDSNVGKRRQAGGLSDISNQCNVKVPVNQFECKTQCCANSCYKAIPSDQKLEITRHLQSLNSKREKDRYVSRFIVSKEIKSRCVKTIRKSQYNRWGYTVMVGGANSRVEVCKQLFLQLFHVTEKRLKTITGKMSKGCMDFNDRRGLHNNRPHRIQTEVLSHLSEHLMSLRTDLECLGNSRDRPECQKPRLIITKMFAQFQEYFKEKTNTKLNINYNTYYKYLRKTHYLEQFMPHRQKRENTNYLPKEKFCKKPNVYVELNDRRGLHNNRPHRIQTEVWSHLNEHLVLLRTELERLANSFGWLECQKPTLTVAKMFALFQEYFKEKTQTKLNMKYNTYYKYLSKNHYLEQFMPHREKRENTSDLPKEKFCKMPNVCMELNDRRGLPNNRPHRIQTEVWFHLHEHLVSLRTELERLAHSLGGMECQKPTLTVTKMFALFQEYFKEKTHTKLNLKYNTYYKYLSKNHYLEQFMPHRQNRAVLPKKNFVKESAFILVVSDEAG